MLEKTVKQELVDKLRALYRKKKDEDLPSDYTDDEVAYTVLLFLFEEIFLP